MSIAGEASAGSASSQDMEEILYTTIILALERDGWQNVVRSPGNTSAGPADFRLSVRYTVLGNRVSLSFRLEDAKGRVPAETRSLERILDLQFDVAVGKAVELLSRGARTALAALPVPEPVPENAGLPPEAGVPGTSAQRPRGSAGLRIDVGLFLPFGGARDYFRVASRIEAVWLFPSGLSEHFRAVGSVGVTAISLETKGAPGGDTLFIHSGIGMGYAFNREKLIGFDISVQAGPALVLVRGGGIPPIQKLLPFGQAGIAAGYRPSPRWEFGLSAAVQVLLDYGEEFLPLQPVWGLVPTFTVTREL